VSCACKRIKFLTKGPQPFKAAVRGSEKRDVNGTTRAQNERLSALPRAGEALSMRLACCNIDLPTRVVDVQGARVFVTAPLHVCRRSEIGAQFTATWESNRGVGRSSGTVESQRRHPPTWVLSVDGPIEFLDLEPRYSDDSPGLVDIGGTRLPARIVDRSLHGVGCVVPALAALRPGQRVRVIVGRHSRAGTIARVRPFGTQLRLGIRLDEVEE
jgi:hypothetical protein